MKIINKLFGRLPKPYALPIRSLANSVGYTWEDWREKNKKIYPLRYWLHETLPRWFRVKIVMRAQNMWYWFRTHTFNRYHILDLRSDVGAKYKWGWVEIDYAMMLACFNLLRFFVEKEDGLSYLKWDSQSANLSSNEKAMHDKQYNDFIEIKKLYDWWMNGREKEHEIIKNFYALKENHLSYKKTYGDALQELDEKDDEMLAKLIKYRRYLWT